MDKSTFLRQIKQNGQMQNIDETLQNTIVSCLLQIRSETYLACIDFIGFYEDKTFGVDHDTTPGKPVIYFEGSTRYVIIATHSGPSQMLTVYEYTQFNTLEHCCNNCWHGCARLIRLAPRAHPTIKGMTRQVIEVFFDININVHSISNDLEYVERYSWIHANLKFVADGTAAHLIDLVSSINACDIMRNVPVRAYNVEDTQPMCPSHEIIIMGTSEEAAQGGKQSQGRKPLLTLDELRQNEKDIEGLVNAHIAKKRK